jgi:hypothetical protein
MSWPESRGFPPLFGSPLAHPRGSGWINFSVGLVGDKIAGQALERDEAPVITARQRGHAPFPRLTIR